MVSHCDCKHSCLIKKNVPVVFIFPSRWQDGAESLGIETHQAVYDKIVCNVEQSTLALLAYTFHVQIWH